MHFWNIIQSLYTLQSTLILNKKGQSKFAKLVLTTILLEIYLVFTRSLRLTPIVFLTGLNEDNIFSWSLRRGEWIWALWRTDLIGGWDNLHRLYACAVNLYKWQYNIKTEQSHDVAPSLYSTAISIDSPHIRKDGAKYLNLLLFHLKLIQMKLTGSM